MADDRDDPTIHWIEPRRRGDHPARRASTCRAACARLIRRGRFEIRVDTAFARGHPRLRRADAGAAAHLAQRRADRALHRAAPRAATPTASRCWRDGALVGGLYGVSPGRRLLRREHVLPRARRQQGGPGRAGRPPARRRLPAARHPVRHRPPRPLRCRRDAPRRVQAAAGRALARDAQWLPAPQLHGRHQ